MAFNNDFLAKSHSLLGLEQPIFTFICILTFSLTVLWLAVAVNAKLHYAIVELLAPSEDVSFLAGNKKKKPGNILKEEKRPFLVVASDLVPTLEAKWGVKLVVKKKLLGSELENCRFHFSL